MLGCATITMRHRALDVFVHTRDWILIEQETGPDRSDKCSAYVARFDDGTTVFWAVRETSHRDEERLSSSRMAV
jgi:hypothetical protein